MRNVRKYQTPLTGIVCWELVELHCHVEKVHPISCAAPGSNTSVKRQQASPQRTQHQPLQTKTLFALFINHVIGYQVKFAVCYGRSFQMRLNHTRLGLSVFLNS